MATTARPATAPPSRPATSNGKDAEVNVQVILRCRPINEQEKAQRTAQAVKCCEASREVTVMQTVGNKRQGRTFKFDRVFGQKACQSTIYDAAVDPIVQEVLDGFNCTIFAYGQTGTGKTHTMEGEIERDSKTSSLDEQAGVIPRAIAQIFNTLESAGSEYSVKVSYLELYNERITDLLGIGDDVVPNSGDYQLCEDGRGGVVVRGLEDEIVKSSDEIFEVLSRGAARRRTAETKLNKESSRSHSVFTITIHIKETTPEGEEMIKCGKLNLVDLAGSENISRSGAKKERAREAGEINKSLLTLGRVISALVEHQSHIPYRDSKLTRLLRDSLGGRTKTCIIATIAPTVHCCDETLNTLDYAQRAKSIKNRPEVNRKISKHALIKDLTTQIDRLKADLIATREKNGIYLSKDHYEEQIGCNKSLQEQVHSLEAQIEEKEEELAAIQKMFDDLKTAHGELNEKHAEVTHQFEHAMVELDQTCEALESAKTGIAERDYLIAAHAHAEDAIVSHAIQIAETLHAVTDETSKLHTKLERKDDVEESNIASLKALKAAASKHVASLKKAAKDASKEHTKMVATADEGAKSLLAAQEAHAEAAKAGIVAASAQVSQGEAEGKEASKALASKVASALSEASDREASQSQAGVEAMLTLCKSSGTALGGMAEGVSKSVALVGEASATHKANLSLLAKKADGVASTAATVLGQVNATAGTCKATMGEHTVTLKQRLDAMRAEMVASLQTHQERMVQVLSDALAESIKTQTAAVSAFFAEVEGAIEESAKAMGDDLGSVAHTADVGHQQIECMQEECAEAAKKGAADADASEASLGAALSDLGGAVDETKDAIMASIKTMVKEERARGKQAAASFASMADDVNATSQALVATVESAAASVLEHTSGVTQALEASSEALQASVQSLTEGGAAQREAIARHKEAATQGASDLGGLVASFDVATDAPTGETPGRTARQVPKRSDIEALRTPAPELMLKEFRSNNTKAPADATAAAAEGAVVEEGAEEVENALTPEAGTKGAGTKGGIVVEGERPALAAITNSPAPAQCVES